MSVADEARAKLEETRKKMHEEVDKKVDKMKESINKLDEVDKADAATGQHGSLGDAILGEYDVP